MSLTENERFAIAVQDAEGTPVLTDTVGPGEEMALCFKPADYRIWVGTCRWTVWVEREVEGEWDVVAPAEEWRTFRVLLPPPTATPTETPTPVPPTQPPPKERPKPKPTEPPSRD